MATEYKNNFIDWLISVIVAVITTLTLIWLFGGCNCLSPRTHDIASANKLASGNVVEAHRTAQERRTQVGLINVSSEISLREFAGVIALTVILIFVLYKFLYHWKSSPEGRFFKR